jgi:hypothetical protein
MVALVVRDRLAEVAQRGLGQALACRFFRG